MIELELIFNYYIIHQVKIATTKKPTRKIYMLRQDRPVIPAGLKPAPA